MKAAIIGAGNGGLCIGAYLSLQGVEISLYDKFEEAVAPVRERGGVELKGVVGEGFAPFALVGSDLKAVIADCPLIMVVTPAFVHRELAEACGPCLTRGQVVVLNPGRTCGALEFYTAARRAGGTDFLVAEAQSLIYACRRSGPAEGTIHMVKNTMPLAALPSARTPEVLALLNRYYPQFTAAENVLETSLMNIGAIFHPAPTLLNIARIEGQERFRHYIDGISPCVGTLLEAIDRERVALAEALGTPTLTTVQWLKSVYGEDIEPGASIYEAVQRQKAYQDIWAGRDPYVRYITEDVPHSLVPLSELALIAGLPTPAIDTIINLASIVHQRDYRREGRNLASLGLAGFDKKSLQALVTNG